MNGLSSRNTALLIVLALQLQPVAAQAPKANSKEPEAMAALDRMGATLRRLNSFGLQADVTQEQVLTTGQKLQYGSRLTYQVRRPNGLKIDMASDRQSRSIYYDGKTITVAAPLLGYYASASAPPTIAEMLRTASKRHGIELPLADLFTWGTDADQRNAITSAFEVASETIAGKRCGQYAFRQASVDWQIWIAEGTEALPCKIVITTTDDPSMPQFSALLTWQPRQNFAASTFTYKPPPTAQKIVLGTAAP